LLDIVAPSAPFEEPLSPLPSQPESLTDFQRPTTETNLTSSKGKHHLL